MHEFWVQQLEFPCRCLRSKIFPRAMERNKRGKKALVTLLWLSNSINPTTGKKFEKLNNSTLGKIWNNGVHSEKRNSKYSRHDLEPSVKMSKGTSNAAHGSLHSDPSGYQASLIQLNFAINFFNNLIFSSSRKRHKREDSVACKESYPLAPFFL